MKKTRLNQKFIDGLPFEKMTCQDADCPALILQVSNTSKTFYFLKVHKYRQYKKSLGNVSEISRQQAIDKCSEYSVNLGKFGKLLPGSLSGDGNGERLTVADANTYYTEEKHPSEKRSFFWNLLAPLHNRMIDTITRDDMTEFHKQLTRDRGSVTANRTVAILRTTINYVIRTGKYTGVNPASNIQMNMEKPRQRYLMPSEAPAVIGVLERMRGNPRTRDSAEALLLMLYTWQRKANVLAMEWHEIDETNLWTIPADKAKAGKDICVALAAEAVEIIAKRRDECGGKETQTGKGSKYVFPGRIAGTCMLDCKRVWKTVKKECRLENCHIHDLRHTGATYALRSGADITTVSAALGHANVSFTARVYAHVMNESKREATRGAIDAMMGKK